MNTALQFAKDVQEMQDRIEDLEYQVACLKDYEAKYNELLNSSLAHSKHMVGSLIGLCLKPGVMEALGASS